MKFKSKKFKEEQWPDLIYQIASSLEAGLPLSEALQELKLVSNELKWLPVENQIKHIMAGPHLSLVRASLLMIAQHGGHGVKQLKTCAGILRKRIELKHKVDTFTAQGRATAWVVGTSPFVLLGMLAWISPDFVKPLLTTPLGHIFLLVVFILVLLGLILVHRIIDIL